MLKFKPYKYPHIFIIFSTMISHKRLMYFPKNKICSSWDGGFRHKWPFSTMRACRCLKCHHQGCLNNPIFSSLGLCAACWVHFMCHHELWPISASHPFSNLNSSWGLADGKHYQKLPFISLEFFSNILSFHVSFLHSVLAYNPRVSTLMFGVWRRALRECLTLPLHGLKRYG